MNNEAKLAVAEFAKGIFTYVEDGNVIELHECGFVQELLNAIKEGEVKNHEVDPS